MIWGVRVLVIALLGVSAWRVHQVRGRLASEDADPVAVVGLKARLEAIPLSLGEGQLDGRPEPISDNVIRESGADCFTSRVYTDDDGNEFRLYVGGAIRNQENFHAPSYCMPAAGWETLEDSVVPFGAYAVQNREPHMRRLLLQYGSRRMVVYYWFQAGPRLADHEWVVRYYRFLDLVADEPFRPTLIVTLYSPVRRDVPTTEEAARRFLKAIGPHLRSAIVLGD